MRVEKLWPLMCSLALAIGCGGGEVDEVEPEGFAATGLDVSPDGERYVYGVNGQAELTLREL